MRRRLEAAVGLLAWPCLVTFGALIQPWDGGRLIRWLRQPPVPDDDYLG